MLRNFPKRSFLMFPCVLAMLLLTACGNDPAQPTVPGVEPEVVNNPDVFQFQVSTVEDYTGMLEYVWTNTGTLANVDQSCNVQPGQATLVLFDAAGREVYRQDLAVDGSSASSPGAAGDWQIRIECTSMSGTLNFRAEKRTP